MIEYAPAFRLKKAMNWLVQKQLELSGRGGNARPE